MANRDRRSIIQPSSYKKFNEVGTGEDILSENQDNLNLPLQEKLANGGQDILENTINTQSSARTTDYRDDAVALHVDHDEDDLDSDAEARKLKHDKHVKVSNATKNTPTRPTRNVDSINKRPEKNMPLLGLGAKSKIRPVQLKDLTLPPPLHALSPKRDNENDLNLFQGENAKAGEKMENRMNIKDRLGPRVNSVSGQAE